MKDLKCNIQFMKEEELPEIARIEKENFSDPWSKKAFLDSIHQENTCFLTAYVKEEIAGYCGCYLSFDEAELPVLSVKKEYQGKKIASQLLGELDTILRQKEVHQLFLEVRESNFAARNLYEKHGFATIGKRPGFYDFPKEDAVLMKKGIAGTATFSH